MFVTEIVSRSRRDVELDREEPAGRAENPRGQQTGVEQVRDVGPVEFRCAEPQFESPRVSFGQFGASSTSSSILRALDEAPQTVPLPVSQPEGMEQQALAWLVELRRLAVDSDEDVVRIQRRYAHLSFLGRRRYNRRGTRGSGVRYLGGEEALVTSLDEYCYVKAAEPGFVFSDTAKMLLYRQSMADAQIRGFWVLTSTGTVNFPAGQGGIYLSDLARRASEGAGFRGHLESRNREIDYDNWIEDWRAYYRQSRNIVDIGVFEKLGLRWRRWTHKTFGLALPRPPRQ
jgi:hypothetical protein